jgi:anti-sigma B factor antagonist
MLEITFRRSGNVAILDLCGTIDINSSTLIEKVAWCLENGYEDILCNFEEVDLVDYSGLSVIAIAYKNTVNHKGRMKFTNLQMHIKNMFSLVSLDKVFDIYAEEELALRSFEEERNISEIQKIKLRRRFKRLPLDINCEFKAKHKEENFHKGKVLNLSAVGFLVFTDKIYPLGEILKVKLTLLPKPGLVEVEAKVVWQVQKEIQPQIYPAMGLEFYKLATEMQRKIVEFVERNLPLSARNE